MPSDEATFKPSGRIYVKELGQILNRETHTIHMWERTGVMPRGCEPRRDSRGWRYWEPHQVDAFQRWLETRRPQSDEKLRRLREKRGENRPGNVVLDMIEATTPPPETLIKHLREENARLRGLEAENERLRKVIIAQQLQSKTG